MASDPCAYPLSWPTGVPRHRGERSSARFRKTELVPSGLPSGASWRQHTDLTLAQALERVLDELRRFGAGRVVVSTNIELRLDGLPRSGRPAPTDPGVAVYFHLRKRPYCLPCDRWRRVPENLAAVAAHLSAMRGMERWGVGTVEQAFTGYAALPAPDVVDWRAEFPRAASLAEVEERYRERAKALHPDTEGSHDAMVRLNRARDAARLEFGAGQ